MSFVDPNVQLAIESLIASDPQFKRRVEQLTLLSMKTLLDALQTGTPDQKLAVAKSFTPIMVKALSGQKKDDADSLSEAEKIRQMISGVIPHAQDD